MLGHQDITIIPSIMSLHDLSFATEENNLAVNIFAVTFACVARSKSGSIAESLSLEDPIHLLWSSQPMITLHSCAKLHRGGRVLHLPTETFSLQKFLERVR